MREQSTVNEAGHSAQEDFLQKHMPGEVCFGCGQENPHGLKIRSVWEGDDCVCTWVPEEKHQGWPGITCGGIISNRCRHGAGHAMTIDKGRDDAPLRDRHVAYQILAPNTD